MKAKKKRYDSRFARQLVRAKESFSRGKVTPFYASWNVSKMMDDLIERMNQISFINILTHVKVPKDFQPGAISFNNGSEISWLDNEEKIIPSNIEFKAHLPIRAFPNNTLPAL